MSNKVPAPLQLPDPPEKYSVAWAASLIRALVAADFKNLKSDRETPQQIFTDTVTGTRYKVSIASGVWTLTAI